MVSGWCRVLSGLEVSGRCQGLSGLSVCEDAYALSRAVGAVELSGCRVLGGVGWCRAVGAVSGRAALICGVKLAPRFDPNNSKQGVEESNPNMHTLKYMRLKISLNPRSSVRLRPFKALKKLFDLHRKKTCESSAKMNISNPNTNSAPLPWHVSLALLDPCWTSLSATSTQGAQGCLGQHLLAWAFVPLWCALCFLQK